MTGFAQAGISIRPLRPADREDWSRLWQAYLTFYEAALTPAVTEATWSRLHEEAEPVFGLVAEYDGAVVGLTHYLFHRSTWLLAPACYLQDLIVIPDARRQGIGTALIQAVYQAAADAGADLVYWMTQEGNARARAVYDRIGHRSGFIVYQQPS